MCGIAGFIGFNDNDLLNQMSIDMLHRGPDGDGSYIADGVSLLNRRLAIIDRKGGNQPIYNEDKTIVTVYNGEIYNYKDLRTELEARGHTFYTQTDTEIIVHGYEEWGAACFDKFNGMFGIALYDIPKKKLILARDHFGIKPVYFAQTSSGSFQLLFASEIKPLFNSGRIDRLPNDKTIYRYLTYRIHDDARDTFFKGVQRLLPGEYMEIQNGQYDIKKYTSLRKELETSSNDSSKKDIDQQDIETFRSLLTKSIQDRLVSEVPVGTCLSGGLDSSTVVATANQLLNDKKDNTQSLGSKQRTYSAVFPGSVNDETHYIDDLLKDKDSIISEKIYPKPETFFEDLNDFIYYQEEPTISTGPYAQYCVMKRAHKDVTVLLDGQGADEMMAGYLPYYYVYYRQLFQKKQYGQLLQEIFSSWDIGWKLLKVKLQTKLRLKKPINTTSLLSPSFISAFQDKVTFKTEQYSLKKRLLEDIFQNSLQSLLRYEDKNAMRFSIEGRVPFLDLDLIRHIFSLPDSAIIHNGWNKYILRQAFADLLPDSIEKRRNKIGFTTPEDEWFLRMKNRIYGMFLSESFASRPYFNQQEVLKAFEQFIQGKSDDSMVFWRVLNIEIWLQLYFDEKKDEIETKERKYFQANADKTIERKVDDKIYLRFPVKTDFFQKGDDFARKIASDATKFYTHVSTIHSKNNHFNAELKIYDKLTQQMLFDIHKNQFPWIAIISEKIVAISQGRSYFIWDIKPNFFAKLLSKFVKKTPYGIGLGSPWTMQLAIDEVGLPRILFASIASLVTKPFGLKGVFYHIVGRTVASIDGPTEYSLYPSNVSAKLGPKNPQNAAEEIKRSIEQSLQKDEKKQFYGVVIIDANDLGRDILGNATDYSNEHVAKIMEDNPMGQGREQTPIIICFEKLNRSV